MKNHLDLKTLYVETSPFRIIQVCRSVFEPVWVTWVSTVCARSVDHPHHALRSTQLKAWPTATGAHGKVLFWCKNRRNSFLTSAGTFVTGISFHTAV